MRIVYILSAFLILSLTACVSEHDSNNKEINHTALCKEIKYRINYFPKWKSNSDRMKLNQQLHSQNC
jgi:hypothetical protein